MSLQEVIKADMVASMKAKKVERTNVMKLVVGEMGRYKEGKETFKVLTDEQALKVIKFCYEGAKTTGSQTEMDILDEFLPKMLDEDHVKLIVEGIISARGWSGKQFMGQVMGEIKKHPNASQIDGKISSKIVKELLG